MGAAQSKNASRGLRYIAACVLIMVARVEAQQPPPPQPLPPPPVPPQNPITEPKRVLGKMLFWDEQLSSNNTVSCGTCHQPFRSASDFRHAVNPGLDGLFNTADDVFGSFGVARTDENGNAVSDPIFGLNRQVTKRSAPPMMNALWSPLAFWDGRAGPSFVDPQTGQTVIPQGGALESQSIAPIMSDSEMAFENRTWDDVTGKLQSAVPMALATYLPPDVDNALASNPTYPALFAAAYGDSAITARRIAFAIATFERTLVANQTPFDTNTLTAQQQRGLGAFQNQASRCTVCHVLPFFTNNSFRNIGLRPIAEDTGRQAITNDPNDAGRFKVPGLRNLGLKTTYMHNGRRSTLEQVLDFYQHINGAQQFPQNQDPAIPGINIPPDARVDLIEFLRHGLTDPRVASESAPFDRPILASERGDSDRDGDVDATDRANFAVCFTGSNAGPVDLGCERLDMDGDGDVDCVDWEGFKAAWTAGGQPPSLPQCEAQVAPDAPLREPSPIDKIRFVSFVPQSAGATTAIRVTLDSLHHPDPPNIPQNPAPNFAAFEDQLRWVGPPTVYCESGGVPPCAVPGDGTFVAAKLQCTPFYSDWSTITAGGVLHLTGIEIMPSSSYYVEALAATCQGSEAGCGLVSPGIVLNTARWGDVVAPYQSALPAPLTQPDISDVAAIVDKFKGRPLAESQTIVRMQPNSISLSSPVNIADVAADVDAFKNKAYPYPGPVTCP
ncbi:MAG: hypothetical protein HY287_02065 [Planctomycetes bacterium]|nr:hypothetical protein [Planctomycetota bacterium]MBI3833096.1 hypothetical protein [Planctomycetota bacterium]